MPTISVIVPVYKVEQYIHRCIDSILAQTFTDFELLLVDDGSPDNCGAICDEYAAKDSRVRVLHQENKGQAAARNLALDWMYANSDSGYIAFVDSDDWVHPRYLELLYKAVEETGATISVCKYYPVDDTTRIPEVGTGEHAEYSFEYFFCLKIAGIDAVVPIGRLYQKLLFETIRFPAGKIFEDLFIIPKVLFRGGRIAVVDEVLYYYYQSESSTMRSRWSIRRLDEIEASEELMRFIQENCGKKANEQAVRRYLTVLDRQMKEIAALPKGEKNARIYLGRKFRWALLQNRNVCPIKNYRWMYEQAFPKTAWCYWTCVGVIGKIKKMVKKDANN